MAMKWYQRPWVNGLMIFMTSILTLVLLINAKESVSFLPLVFGLKLGYIGIALGAMLLYGVLEAYMLHLLIDSGHSRMPLLVAFRSMVCGQYYSLITPFASGGQPMQYVALVKDGVTPRHATAVLINKFLYFQIGVTLYGLTLAFVHWRTLLVLCGATMGMMGLGLLVNSVGLGILVAMIFRPVGVKRGVMLLTSRFKRLSHKRRSWLKGVEQVALSTRDMMTHPVVALKMMGLTWLQLTAYFSLGYWVYRAFGFSGLGFFELLTLQVVLYLSVSLLPTPGSAGAAEGGFFLFFGGVFTAGTLAGALLVWRGISYYFALVVSGLASLALYVYDLRRV